MGKPEDASGVSYRDVESYLRAVEGEHCCNVKFEMTVPVVTGTAVLFWVTVVATPRIVGRKTIRGPIARQRSWPHVDHRTLAGLMLWLLFDIDKALEESGYVPAEQATFAWA